MNVPENSFVRYSHWYVSQEDLSNNVDLKTFLNRSIANEFDSRTYKIYNIKSDKIVYGCSSDKLRASRQDRKCSFYICFRRKCKEASSAVLTDYCCEHSCLNVNACVGSLQMGSHIQESFEKYVADLSKLQTLVHHYQSTDCCGFYRLLCSRSDNNIEYCNPRQTMTTYSAKFKALAVIPSYCIHFWNNSRKIQTWGQMKLKTQTEQHGMYVCVKDACDRDVTVAYCIAAAPAIQEVLSWFVSILVSKLRDCQLIINGIGLELNCYDRYLNCFVAQCLMQTLASVHSTTRNDIVQYVLALARSTTQNNYSTNLEIIHNLFGQNVATYLHDHRQEYCYLHLKEKGLLTNYGEVYCNIPSLPDRNMTLGESLSHFVITSLQLFRERNESAQQMIDSSYKTSPTIVKEVLKNNSLVAIQVRVLNNEDEGEKFVFELQYKDKQGSTSDFIIVEFSTSEHNWYNRIICPCKEFIIKGYPCCHAGHILTLISNGEVRDFVDTLSIWTICNPHWYSPIYHVTSLLNQYSPSEMVDYSNIHYSHLGTTLPNKVYVNAMRYCNKLCINNELSPESCLRNDVIREMGYKSHSNSYMKMKRFLATQQELRETYQLGYDSYLHDAHYGMVLNCKYCTYIHPKVYNNSKGTFVDICPLYPTRMFRQHFQSCVGFDNKQYVTSSSDTNDEGLYATHNICKGVKLAVYHGAIVVPFHHKVQHKTNSLKRKASIVNGSARKCFSTGSLDHSNGSREHTNAELIISLNEVDQPWVRSTQSILAGKEIFINLGTLYSRVS